MVFWRGRGGEGRCWVDWLEALRGSEVWEGQQGRSGTQRDGGVPVHVGDLGSLGCLNICKEGLQRNAYLLLCSIRSYPLSDNYG